MNIPDRINILGIETKTVEDDEALGEDNLGLCDYTHSLIVLKRNDGMEIAPQTVALTWLHEILHHIDLALELKMSERQIRCMSVGIYQVLHDNKLVF